MIYNRASYDGKVQIIVLIHAHPHTASCSDGDLKLVGDSEREGRLEVCFNQRWGTVNGDGWSSIDTEVACRQLGYSTSGITKEYALKL